MGIDRILVLPPSFDHHLGLLEGVEYLSVKQFISQPAVEVFVAGILLPRAAGLNTKSQDTHVGQPLTHGLGGELRAVV